MSSKENTSQKESESFHILLLPSWYPNETEPHLGNFIEQFAIGLSNRHKVTVLYNDFTSKEKYGVEQVVLNSNLTVCRVFVPSTKSSFLRKNQSFLLGLDHIKNQLPEIDLIHCQVGIRDWFQFLRMVRQLKKPMIYTEHGSFVSENQFNKISLLKRLGIKKMLKKSNQNITVSESLAKSMQSISSKTVQVIPNFLPNEWFDLPVLSAVNELYQVLHISTLDENKNPKGILEACRMLIAEGIINWHLTIVSEENFAELKKWVLNEKMDQYVSFRSHVPHNDIPNLYLNHHSFILNSNQETFSIVNAEALCFGLHLISTNVGFLKDHTEDWIDKIESGNVIDVKDKLKSAILNRKLSGKQGRTFVEKFKEDQILDQYDAIYKRLIG